MNKIILSLALLLASVPPAMGQSASGLLGTNRYIDWSQAGSSSIPARPTICQTLGVSGQVPTYAQSTTAANILSALQACTSGQTVYMNPGTYTMTQTLGPTGGAPWPNNVTLRGAGASQTILKWSSGAGLNNCNGIGPTAMCVTNGDSGALQYSANVLTVSSGMTQGSTSAVLGSAPGGFSGSLSNLHVGSLIAFNQLDLTSDNGAWYMCGIITNCSQQGSANAWNSPSGTYRAQAQMVTVTNISGSTVTFTPAIYAPNWSSGLTPYATFSSKVPAAGIGIENLQINTQALGDIQAMLEFMWATNSWVSNVAFINNDATSGGDARKHVEAFSDAHLTIKDSYFFGSSPSSEAYGVDFGWGTSDSLAQNNICQHIATCTITEEAAGNVFGYNFAVDNFYTGGGSAPNWQQGDCYGHNDGDYYNLWEGHEGIMCVNDNIHGPHVAVTVFRSYLSGHDPATLCPGGGTACGTGAKSQNTFAVFDMAYARYMNIFMNVLGSTSYATTYQNTGLNSSCPSYPAQVVYGFNFQSGNQTCGGADPLTLASSARWGNYDTVHGSVQTNSGETGSSASTYPGLSSPSTTWASYKSLYLAAQPSWWGTMPWPAVGPDVTGGNVPNVGGHVYQTPASNCYHNVLGGVDSGASPVLPFEATNCYSGGGGTNYSLSVSTNGTGSGSISGTNCTSGTYASGTSIACTATPSGGSTFAGWSGGVCSGTGTCALSLSANSTVVVTFNLTGGTAGTPAFAPSGGAQPYNTTINISTTPSGCNSNIYWSLTNPPDSGDVNGTAFQLLSSNTWYAKVIGCPGYADSSVGTASFTISSTCATPQPLPPSLPNTYISPPTSLPLLIGYTESVPGCGMHITLDGSTPTCASASYADQTISTTTQFGAIACQTGYTTSAPVVNTWTILFAQAAAPTFSPLSPYSGAATTVALSSTTPSPTISYCQDTTNTCTPTIVGTTVSFTTTGFIRAFTNSSGYTQSPTSSWSGTLVATPTPTAAIGLTLTPGDKLQ